LFLKRRKKVSGDFMASEKRRNDVRERERRGEQKRG